MRARDGGGAGRRDRGDWTSESVWHRDPYDAGERVVTGDAAGTTEAYLQLFGEPHEDHRVGLQDRPAAGARDERTAEGGFEGADAAVDVETPRVLPAARKLR
jgi:hypothetical protein